MATTTATRQVLNPDLVKYGLTEAQAKRLQSDPNYALFTYDPGVGGKEILASDNKSLMDKIAVAGWSADPGTHRISASDLYVTETYQVTTPDPKPVIKTVPKTTTKKTTTSVGGNTATQTQAATTTTTQTGKQSQGTDQVQRNDANQSMSGQGNVALVVTPNAESNQQLESQAFGSASQTQQVEVASQADAASAMTNDQSAVGATYNVSPVINVDAADVYTSQSNANAENARQFMPQLDGSTSVLIAGAVVAGLYLVTKFIGSKPKSTTNRRKKDARSRAN